MTQLDETRRGLLQLGGAAALGAGLWGGPAAAQASRRFDMSLTRPESVGMSSAGIARVNQVMQGFVDNGTLSGAVIAIARRGRLVDYQAFGISDAETKAAMRKDAIFRMMSSTKPTVGVAVLQQIEEGKINLNDPVSRFIPEFKGSKVAIAAPGAPAAAGRGAGAAAAGPAPSVVPAVHDITVRDLMTHTSGLSSGGPGNQVLRVQRRPGDKLADHIPRLGAVPLDFQPGTRWRYSASDGIDVLSRIVEITAKTPIDVYQQERIFGPLGMVDTTYNVPQSKRSRILTLYQKAGAEWRPSRAAFGYAPTVYYSGAGGLMSTVHDYLMFEQMLLNKGELNGKRILKPASVELMSTNHVGDLYGGTGGTTKGTGFGLTVRVVLDAAAANTGRSAGAFGWGGAYGTASWTDPKEALTAVMFIQQPVGQVLVDYEKAIRQAIVA